MMGLLALTLSREGEVPLTTTGLMIEAKVKENHTLYVVSKPREIS